MTPGPDRDNSGAPVAPTHERIAEVRGVVIGLGFRPGPPRGAAASTRAAFGRGVVAPAVRRTVGVPGTGVYDTRVVGGKKQEPEPEVKAVDLELSHEGPQLTDDSATICAASSRRSVPATCRTCPG